MVNSVVYFYFFRAFPFLMRRETYPAHARSFLLLLLAGIMKFSSIVATVILASIVPSGDACGTSRFLRGGIGRGLVGCGPPAPTPRLPDIPNLDSPFKERVVGNAEAAAAASLSLQALSELNGSSPSNSITLLTANAVQGDLLGGSPAAVDNALTLQANSVVGITPAAVDLNNLATNLVATAQANSVTPLP
jgi:hypothetical protein